jgi:Ran GTPase-activating protein (RanGAP) involved in mRNA processing and transport
MMSESSRFDNVDEIFEGRLRGNQLMLSGKGLTPEEAELLWQAPKMQEVSWLDLDDNNLGDHGVQGLVECGYLENVQYLNLNQNNVSDEGLRFLADAKYLVKLKRLHLKGNPIMGEGVIALFSSETLENLSTFQVNDGWTCKKREGWRYKPRV